jgi:hypothetical protein
MNTWLAEYQMTDEAILARARADYLRNMAEYIIAFRVRRETECAAIKEAGRAAGECQYEIGAQCNARTLAISDEVVEPFSDAIVSAKRIINAHAPDPRREFRELIAALPDEVNRRETAAALAELAAP